MAPSAILTLALCWQLPEPSALVGLLLLLAAVATPGLPSVLFFGPAPPFRHRFGSHLRALAADLGLAAMQTFLSVAFVADQKLGAWAMPSSGLYTALCNPPQPSRMDNSRTRYRQAAAKPGGFYGEMAGGVLLGLGLSAGSVRLVSVVLATGPALCIGVACRPVLAAWTSRSPTLAPVLLPSDPDGRDLA